MRLSRQRWHGSSDFLIAAADPFVGGWVGSRASSASAAVVAAAAGGSTPTMPAAGSCCHAAVRSGGGSAMAALRFLGPLSCSLRACGRSGSVRYVQEVYKPEHSVLVGGRVRCYVNCRRRSNGFAARFHLSSSPIEPSLDSTIRAMNELGVRGGRAGAPRRKNPLQGSRRVSDTPPPSPSEQHRSDAANAPLRGTLFANNLCAALHLTFQSKQESSKGVCICMHAESIST